MSLRAPSVHCILKIEVITDDCLNMNGKQLSKIFKKCFFLSSTWSWGLIVTYDGYSYLVKQFCRKN